MVRPDRRRHSAIVSAIQLAPLTLQYSAVILAMYYTISCDAVYLEIPSQRKSPWYMSGMEMSYTPEIPAVYAHQRLLTFLVTFDRLGQIQTIRIYCSNPNPHKSLIYQLYCDRGADAVDSTLLI